MRKGLLGFLLAGTLAVAAATACNTNGGIVPKNSGLATASPSPSPSPTPTSKPARRPSRAPRS